MVSGRPEQTVLNRSEARRPDFLDIRKSSEGEGERMKPLECAEHVCEDLPTQKLILTENSG